ncbi:hypothetical protein D3C75_561740 [compost metagenome]
MLPRNGRLNQIILSFNQPQAAPRPFILHLQLKRILAPRICKIVKTVLLPPVRLNGDFAGTVLIPVYRFKVVFYSSGLQDRRDKVHEVCGVIAFFPEKTAFLIRRNRFGVARPGVQVQSRPAKLNGFLKGTQYKHLADFATVVIRPDIQQRYI